MRTIWKFPLTDAPKQEVPIPSGSRALCVGMQEERLYLWCQVESESPRVLREVFIFGTGSPLPHAGFAMYVGTVVDGTLGVAHVYLALENT